MEGLIALNKGYVWQQDSGNRIIIIVDDDIEVFKRNRNLLHQIANASGRKVHRREQPLIDLYDGLKSLNSIKAIGFFPLSRPQDGTHRQKREIFKEIKQWIESLETNEYKVYLLVDYFYGDGFNQATVSGEGFVDFWLEQKWLSQNTKIAYFSVGGKTQGGALVRENHHKYLVISKSKVQDEGVSHYKELMSFLELENQPITLHPIDRLCNESAGWFSSSNFGNGISLDSHDLPTDWDDADPQIQEQIEGYKEALKRALEITEIPDNWLKSGSLQNIHQALKHLCGSYFCGQVEDEKTSRRNISTGAAYLIALMAHQKACKNAGAFLSDNIWSRFRQPTALLLPIQDQLTARESAKALYNFFFHVFEPRRSEDLSIQVDGNSCVKKVSLYDEGRVLKIQLVWDARHGDPERSIVQSFKKSIEDGAVQIPQEPSNTREASARLLAYMAVSQNGFGSPGTIYIQEDELVIASVATNHERKN